MNGCIKHEGASALLLKEEYKQIQSILYHVKFTVKETGDSFEKIGITTLTTKKRFNQLAGNHDLELEVINEYPMSLYDAIEKESQYKSYLLENNLAFRVHTLKKYNIGGWTECFRCGELDMLFNT